jgi:hypothetical protein
MHPCIQFLLQSMNKLFIRHCVRLDPGSSLDLFCSRLPSPFNDYLMPYRLWNREYTVTPLVG